MSKLKLSPNLFMEVNELNKMVDFIGNDGYKLILKHLIKEYGIAQNIENNMFKVSHKVGTDNVVTINPGIAIDSDINIIRFTESVDINIPFTTDKQWLAISYATTNNEVGTVDVSAQGALIGNNTKFLSVLRGQPNFPTRIKLSSNFNKEEYEVVDVTSDTEATIVGSFIEEKDLKYQVIGTFTPGFQPNDEDKMIYEYDYCRIHIIDSIEKPNVEDNVFIIASIEFVDNVINVIDKRSNFFNEKNDVKSSSAVSSSIVNSNPLVSLIKTKILKQNFLDFQIEWGYKVNAYELKNTSTSNVFTIVNGNSNYITNITDNLFNGWKLLNRKNMMSVNIDYNIANSLYISVISSSLITNENDDFVIVPNFSEIEFEVKMSGENYDINSPNNYFKFSVSNRIGRFNIPVEYLDTFVELKYRMINDKNKTTIFQNFSVAQFENIKQEKETLGNSSFSIYIEEPEEAKRNYS